MEPTRERRSLGARASRGGAGPGIARTLAAPVVAPPTPAPDRGVPRRHGASVTRKSKERRERLAETTTPRRLCGGGALAAG